MTARVRKSLAHLVSAYLLLVAMQSVISSKRTSDGKLLTGALA